MKMSEPLQQSDLLPMELPLMASAGDSLAKTSAQQDAWLEWAKELEAVSFLKSCDWSMNYDHDSCSWKMSQTSLLDHPTDRANGLQPSSLSWPSAGMMQNGRIYPRRPWALSIVANVSGLWPTPQAGDYRGFCPRIALRKREIGSRPSGAKISFDLKYEPRLLEDWEKTKSVRFNLDWVADLMGFPRGWCEVEQKHLETPLSRKSRK